MTASPKLSQTDLKILGAIVTPSIFGDVEKNLCEKSLYHFLKIAWPIVEPGTPFTDGPHIKAMCDHLQAVTEGRIRNLLINIPPRCMKSLLVCVFWPAWVWTTKPEKRFMFASYKIDLASRDSSKCRRIIESTWYQNHWHLQVRLTMDSNTKTRFDNERSGFRVSLTVGGGTGEGADYLVVDDPNKITDAFSKVMLENTIQWWDDEWATRLNDPRTGCRIVVMQRISELDLSGHIIKTGVANGTWDHLMLPMEFEPDRRSRTSIGFEDWRQKEGELLWPNRIGLKELAALNLNRFARAGQLQQRPTPRGGGMFKRADFKTVKVAPAVGQTVRYWDRSYTDGGGDWTVGFKLRKSPASLYYVLHICRFQTSAFGTEERIKNIAESDGMDVVQVLEEDPAAGKSEAAYLVRALSGKNVRTVKKRNNKEVCAIPASCQVEAGNVFLVEGEWNEPFLAESEWFPRGENDDQIDGFSGAFNYLNEAQPFWFAMS